MSSSPSFALIAGRCLNRVFPLWLQNFICKFYHIFYIDELTFFCKEEISFLYWGYRILVPTGSVGQMLNSFPLITNFQGKEMVLQFSPMMADKFVLFCWHPSYVSVWIHGFLHICSVSINYSHYSFSCPTCLNFGLWAPLPLDMNPLLTECFLAFWNNYMSQIVLMFLCRNENDCLGLRLKIRTVGLCAFNILKKNVKLPS